MSFSRASREDQRRLSLNSCSTDELDAFDKEAFPDLSYTRPSNGRWRSLPCLAGSSFDGCARVIFRGLIWLIVLAAIAVLFESYSLGHLSSPFTSTDTSQAPKYQPPIDDTQPARIQSSVKGAEPTRAEASVDQPPPTTTQPSVETSRPAGIEPIPASARYQKPVGPKIIGLIFYGRRDRAAILDCYLKRNLVTNGGWLDEVVWGVNTENADDLVYLEEIIPSSPSYRRLDLKETGYVNLWNQSVEHGNIYIKLDDDVVYIHEDAIPLIVNTLITDSRAAVVSANVINSPEHNWVHYRIGAVRPYLPDLEPPVNGSLATLDNPVWKVSNLPSWIGPAGWTCPRMGDFTEKLLELLPSADEESSDVLPNHRWLPLENPSDISKTPIAQTSYDKFGPGWTSWAIAAQQHYSFFYNLDRDQLSAYYMNNGFGQDASAIWDHTGDRLSINMLAVTGDNILDNIDKMAVSESDEEYLTVELPRQLNKRRLPPVLRIYDETDEDARPACPYPSPCQPLCVPNPAGT
jgi:hypothetical protein